MNTKHTPGPWDVRTIDESIGSVDAADGSAVAQAQMRGTLTCHNHEERRANTRLIAAAPDLLEALLESTSELEALMKDKAFYQGGQNILDRARAAIAKATGEDAR